MRADAHGAAPTTLRRASASAAGSTSTAEARCAWSPATPPVPSPTSTSRTKGCGSVTARQRTGPCPCLSARHRRRARCTGTAGSAPRPTVTGCSQYVRRTGRDRARPVRSVVAFSTRARIAVRVHAARRARLLRDAAAAPRRRQARRRRLGSPRHAVGCLDCPARAARPRCLRRARARARRRFGPRVLCSGWPAARRNRWASPPGPGTGRCGSSPTGRGWWQPYRHSGRARHRRSPSAADRDGGRVPRTRLGPEPADDGRDGRRGARRPHDDRRAGRAGPAGSRRQRQRRWRSRAFPSLRSARTPTASRSSGARPTRRPPSGSGTPRTGPGPCVPRPPVALGRRGRRGGGALHPDRPVGAPGARHALPPHVGRLGEARREHRLRW